MRKTEMPEVWEFERLRGVGEAQFDAGVLACGVESMRALETQWKDFLKDTKGDGA